MQKLCRSGGGLEQRDQRRVGLLTGGTGKPASPPHHFASEGTECRVRTNSSPEGGVWMGRVVVPSEGRPLSPGNPGGPGRGPAEPTADLWESGVGVAMEQEKHGLHLVFKKGSRTRCRRQ